MHNYWWSLILDIDEMVARVEGQPVRIDWYEDSPYAQQVHLQDGRTFCSEDRWSGQWFQV